MDHLKHLGRHAPNREACAILPDAELGDGAIEEARHHDFVAVTLALLLESRLPERRKNQEGEWIWIEGDRPLIPQGLGVLVEPFDEHGPWHFMDSGVAALGFTADQRRFLVSWLVVSRAYSRVRSY